jgi:hypothetical protein
MPEENTGVEETAAAGQDTLFTKEDFMGTGVEESAVAEQEEPEETEATEPDVTEPEETQEEAVEKAFAARLKHATEKIREEVKGEIMREITQKQPQGGFPPLPQEEAERLADQYGTSPEVIRAMYAQQALLNRQAQDMQKIAYQIQAQEEYARARSYADAVRKQNPNAPKWDESKLKEFRDDYYKQYGVTLSWRDTYRQLVAEEALNPATYQKIARSVQQETIKKIAAKDKDTVKIQGHPARKPNVNDLSDAEFEKLLEEAKQGKYV